MHVLIVGSVQIGKSTLIRRILAALGRKAYGFETRKERLLALEDGGIPIYIYPAGGPYVQTGENLIGISREGSLEVFTEAFDRFAGQYMDMLVSEERAEKDSVILMDEIGHMETSSEAFCDGIMGILEGSRLVIAAVKDKEKPFLEQVRNHPNARCFYISEENRESIYQEILDFIRTQEHEEEAGLS